jgi:hypothetical protein
MLSEILKKDTRMAIRFNYRPEEWKSKTTFDSGEVKFCMTSLAPNEDLQFTLGTDIIVNMLKKRSDSYCDLAVLPPKSILSLMNTYISGMYSGKYVKNFDIIGLSIYYIGSFFNIVPFLRYSGIKAWAKDRPSLTPLIIGGGGALSFNPEPVAEFFDVIVLGEGETPVNLLIDFMKANRHLPKMDFLKNLSDVSNSFYIPLLKTKTTSLYFNFEKKIVPLDSNDFISKSTNKPVELLRGCYYKCRFCQLSFGRKKSAVSDVNDVVKAIQSYPDEASIYPFAPDESSYPHYKEVYASLGNRNLFRYNQRFNTYRYQDRHSLSDYKVSFGLDAISQRIRDLVEKKITIDQIYKAMGHAIQNFDMIKINLIIAFPMQIENNTDWEEFDKFLTDICEMRRELAPNKCLTDEEIERYKHIYRSDDNAKITQATTKEKLLMFSLNPTPFCAEAQTPMQWLEMGNIPFASRKLLEIREKCTRKYLFLKIEGLNSEESIITSYVLKRGGRELNHVIYDLGCRNYTNTSGISVFNKILIQSLKEHKIDYKRYIRRIETNEELPWDFIHTEFSKDELIDMYNKLLEKVK